MLNQKKLGRLDHLTFKGNHKQTRYGWLRLTPAYSLQLVSELLATHISSPDDVVLDPFCGTGTTALACAESGIACDTNDINPFLLWLARAKSRSYKVTDVEIFKKTSGQVIKAIATLGDDTGWLPPLHQIEKWWDESTLRALARAMCKIKVLADDVPEEVADLLKIAFCRTLIERANVSFGHQSMSFKKREKPALLHAVQSEADPVAMTWENSVSLIAAAALSPIKKQPRFFLCDARALKTRLPSEYYSCVITSPPYPNRMSYIRELRPYMYWLGYLSDARSAGELDWQAIGGTWGCATSNLMRWKPQPDVSVPFDEFDPILERIARTSPLLSLYVHKYFHDMVFHSRELFQVVGRGGVINSIVGNSKFYDVMLPVEQIFAALFERAGFEHVEISVIRKRTSKKELYEFVVSGRKPL
jgi:SAM-dependent methyltransferase